MSIKVFLQKAAFRGGPRVFSERIRPALKKCQEIKITGDPKSNFDVELCFIKSKLKSSKPMVLRIDGCYYQPKRLQNNIPIIQSIKKSKIIIFQSEFSRKQVQKITKCNTANNIVIHNGIDVNWVDSIKPDKKIIPGSFVASANWKRRDNKRPKSMMSGFMEASIDRHLYIIGKTHGEWREKYKNTNIHFLGELNANDSISVMKSCQYMIHLCHIDSCPNSVIEGLACGLNILCTNLGGTKELVKNDGIVLDIDQWDFKPRPFNNIDSVSPSIIAKGIHKLIKLRVQRSDRKDLDISTCAKKYLETIKIAYDKK